MQAIPDRNRDPDRNIIGLEACVSEEPETRSGGPSAGCEAHS